MKYSIYDACFSEQKQGGRGLSAHYLAWELRRRDLVEYPMSQSDIILATLQSTEGILALKTICKKYPQKIIIGGGSASTSPSSWGHLCSVICVGGGSRFLDTLFREGIEAAQKLDNAWLDGDDKRVIVDSSFPWNMPPTQAEDGAFRLWCGMGCKNKCKFCQTGWAYEYSENPDSASVINTARMLLSKNKRIAYLSNDLAQHTFFDRLPPTEHGSYSVSHLLKMRHMPPARQIRLGIEGVSERLRRSVSKPISRQNLIKCTAALNASGKSVRWFLIAGLPGETIDDWLELKDVVQQWKMDVPKGVLALSFTAFCPEPATPFLAEKITDDYWERFVEFRQWFFGGQGWSNRVKLMGPQEPQNRLLKCIRSTGLTSGQLYRGGHVGPNARVRYPYSDKWKQEEMIEKVNA